MYIISADTNSYLKIFPSTSKYEIVADIKSATEFDNIFEARKFIQNHISSAVIKTTDFEVCDVDNFYEGEAVSVDSVTDDDYLSFAKVLLYISKNPPESTISKIKKELSTCDKDINNLYNTVRDSKFNAVGGYKLAVQLKELLTKRRHLKNNIEIISCAKDMIDIKSSESVNVLREYIDDINSHKGGKK